MDRVQLRFRSRSPSFLIQVAVVKIFSQSRVPQRLPSDSPGQAGQGFFRTFPHRKKVRRSRAPRGRTGRGVELMDAVSLAAVSSVAQHGVRILLLVAEKQEWCFLVCSSDSPSYPVAWSRWCRLCTGAACQSWKLLEGISCSTCCVSRCSHLEIWTLPSPSYLSVLLVYGCCLWSTSYSGCVRCLVQQWKHVLRQALGEFQHFLRCAELES